MYEDHSVYCSEDIHVACQRHCSFMMFPVLPFFLRDCLDCIRTLCIHLNDVYMYVLSTGGCLQLGTPVPK